MGYRLAYSTNAYTKWPLERALDDVKSLGFDGAEILADAPHAFPGRIDAAALKAQLRSLKLGVSNLNGNTSLGLDAAGRDPDGFWPSLIDADAAARQSRIDYVKGVIDLARAIGTDTICTATGRRPKEVPRGAAERLLFDSLEQILAHAERKPVVKVGIEYEPGFFIGDARSLLAVLGELEHPLLGANLDLGHAQCVKEDVSETIASLAGRTWNIHIEDIRKRVHDHLIPGLGDMDFAAIRKALDRARYDRWVTLEIYPYKDDPGGAGRQGLEHLRRFLG
jgi:protein FrlC